MTSRVEKSLSFAVEIEWDIPNKRTEKLVNFLVERARRQAAFFFTAHTPNPPPSKRWQASQLLNFPFGRASENVLARVSVVVCDDPEEKPAVVLKSQHSCTECERVFGTAQLLRGHMQAHFKRYACGHCGHSANKPDSIRSHHLVHFTEKVRAPARKIRLRPPTARSEEKNGTIFMYVNPDDLSWAKWLL